MPVLLLSGMTESSLSGFFCVSTACLVEGGRGFASMSCGGGKGLCKQQLTQERVHHRHRCQQRPCACRCIEMPISSTYGAQETRPGVLCRIMSTAAASTRTHSACSCGRPSSTCTHASVSELSNETLQGSGRMPCVLQSVLSTALHTLLFQETQNASSAFLE
jgi:hypothetical protein